MPLFLRVALTILPVALLASNPAGAFKEYQGAKPSAFRIIKPWKMPDISFQNAKGEKVKLAQFRGKVVLLHFWASWCHVCWTETPTVNALAGRIRHKNLSVIALSVDRSMRAARRYLQDKELKHLPLYYDKGMASLRAIGVDGTPTTFLINKDGYMVGFVEGVANWNSPEAVTLLRHFLNN